MDANYEIRLANYLQLKCPSCAGKIIYGNAKQNV
jgi:DNA-directed RNA polymerase subunit RPC12/RpoP